MKLFVNTIMIQPLAIEKYCHAIKDKIIFDNFSADTHITGQKIKSLTDVPQINAFVIKIIFEKWQKEADKLKSDYFDFDHPDVQKALKEFMNKLSFQIKIAKDYFEVVLKEALRDTFDYLENPITFLQDEIFKFKGNEIPYKEIKNRTKFLKIYTKELNSFLTHKQIENQTVRLDVLMRVLEEEFGRADVLAEIKGFISQLTTIMPNNFINLEETKPAFIIPKAPVVEERKLPEVEFIVTNDDEVSEGNEAEEEVEEEVEEEKNQGTSSSGVPVPKIDVDTQQASHITGIETVADGISLQQKYYFIKELFSGDESLFERVVELSDTFTSYDEACNTLWETYAEKLGWVEKEDAVLELFGIINRKFIPLED